MKCPEKYIKTYIVFIIQWIEFKFENGQSIGYETTLLRKNWWNVLIWVTVIGRLCRETDTVLKKLLILIKY